MELDMKGLALAVKTIAEEKNLPEATVQEIVEQALAAAYKRDYGDREQEVRITMNLHNGEVDAYITKDVVELVGDPRFEIDLSKAQAVRKNAAIGETVEIHEKIEDFGRVAAQTAKQVIIQRLREAEREIIMAEYDDKIGTVLNGLVSRVEGPVVRVDLGKAQGIMPKTEQIQGERYYPGQRIKVLLKDVERGFRGPQLVVSRGSADFVEHLFRNEVPEMENNSVEIKKIAREAGVRSKIAVASSVPGVDPVGTFVGGHGTRVNAVMSEIGEQEKIDIVVFDEDTKKYIINALSPTKINKVELFEDSKKASVFVDEDQLSIAIGKSGQNVRLASKLTGYDIDITNSEDQPKTESAAPEAKPAQATPADKTEQSGKIKSTITDPNQKPKLKRKEQLESSLLDAIEEHGE